MIVALVRESGEFRAFYHRRENYLFVYYNVIQTDKMFLQCSDKTRNRNAVFLICCPVFLWAAFPFPGENCFQMRNFYFPPLQVGKTESISGAHDCVFLAELIMVRIYSSNWTLWKVSYLKISDALPFFPAMWAPPSICSVMLAVGPNLIFF